MSALTPPPAATTDKPNTFKKTAVPPLRYRCFCRLFIRFEVSCCIAFYFMPWLQAASMSVSEIPRVSYTGDCNFSLSGLFILPLDYYGLRLDIGVVGAENAHTLGVCLNFPEPADGFKLTLAGKAVAGNNEVVNVAL